MENELKQWNDEIVKSRNNFPVLNLFTTQQLQVIRQQLGQLNCQRISSLPPGVISILMSLSPKICEKDINECLYSIKSKSSLVGQHSSEKLEKLDNLSNLVDNDSNEQTSAFNPEIEVNINVERNAYEELKECYSDEVAYLSSKYCSNFTMEQETLVEDASEWCLINKNSYVDKDPEALLVELQACDNESNLSTQHENDTSPVVHSKGDKINLIEQILIENDIPSELAREAAELYPDVIEEALSYCLDEKNRSTDHSFLQLPSR